MGVNGCVYGCPSWRSVGRPDFPNARFVQVGTYNGVAFVSGSDDGRGFGSVFHHHNVKSQPLSVGIFLPAPFVVARFRALVSWALPSGSRHSEHVFFRFSR